MTRYGLDDDDPHAWDERQPSAICSDCGVAYGKADHDPTTTCDLCSDRRDAWATATESRMAKAAARPAMADPQPGIIDVALVPVALRDHAGYAAWLAALRANAQYGPDALARAWYVAPADYVRHLTTTTPELWTAFKALATRAA